MVESNPQKRYFGLSAFDATVALIVLILVGLVALFAYLGSPARRGAMIAYLYPASDDVPNIWLAPVNAPEEAKAITFSPMGIYDFDVSRDGRFIVYSMRDEVRRMRDLYLIDLDTGNERQLTSCADSDAECYTPAIHPDNSVVAYVRVAVNSNSSSLGVGAPRIWLTDIVSGTTRPLSDDSQLIGHSPQWSPDGNTIAFFSADLANSGILVYNFNPQTSDDASLNFVPALNGSVGALAPNGRSLVFPDMVNRGFEVFTHLKIVDFSQEPVSFRNLTDPNAPIDDIGVQWHPDGERVTIVRRYTDERWTRGYQIYDLDVASGEVLPLLYDENYSHHFFTWDTQGENLLMQRLPLFSEEGNPARPQIWVLNYETGTLSKISNSAYFPRWVLPE